MKLVSLFLALCVSAFAVGSSELSAWKAKMPAVSSTNPIIKQLVNECGFLVRQATSENLPGTLATMKSKADAANAACVARLKPGNQAKTTPADLKHAEEASAWITQTLLPYIAQGSSVDSVKAAPKKKGVTS